MIRSRAMLSLGASMPSAYTDSLGSHMQRSSTRRQATPLRVPAFTSLSRAPAGWLLVGLLEPGEQRREACSGPAQRFRGSKDGWSRRSSPLAGHRTLQRRTSFGRGHPVWRKRGSGRSAVLKVARRAYAANILRSPARPGTDPTSTHPPAAGGRGAVRLRWPLATSRTREHAGRARGLRHGRLKGRVEAEPWGPGY